MADILKTLQVCGSPEAGGAQRFFLRLVTALDRHAQSKVLPIVRAESWLAERLHAQGIPHETLAFGGRMDFSTYLGLRKCIKRFKPHVVMGWMNRACRFLPRGKVATVGRLGGYYDLKYYRRLDWLIGNTPDICRYLAESGWSADRIAYLPNFVDLPERGFKEQGEAIRARYGIPDNLPVLLLAARLHPDKGLDMALQAMARLPREVHCLLAGDGEEMYNLRALAVSLGIADRVHFTGWVNAITPYCAAADIFVVPSRREPLGNVVLEGWAHAMPVIATETPGPKQLITPGENGLLVPVGDHEALARAIASVIESPNLATSLAKAGLETLTAQYSREAVLHRYLDFYRKIIKT